MTPGQCFDENLTTVLRRAPGKKRRQRDPQRARHRIDGAGRFPL